MPHPKSPSKALHISLWIAQVILAALFLMAGLTKSTKPIEELSAMMPWAAQVPGALVRFIGISELLGALGLVLPSLLRIRPQLTPLAAWGLAVIMLLAAVYHVVQNEFSVIGMNILLGAVAVFIAWGRSKKVPIFAKTAK